MTATDLSKVSQLPEAQAGMGLRPPTASCLLSPAPNESKHEASWALSEVVLHGVKGEALETCRAFGCQLAGQRYLLR